jgi:hypothetical protein
LLSLVIPPFVFPHASCFFEQFEELKVIHASELIDFALLNDMVWIGVGNSYTLYVVFKLIFLVKFILNF